MFPRSSLPLVVCFAWTFCQPAGGNPQGCGNAVLQSQQALHDFTQNVSGDQLAQMFPSQQEQLLVPELTELFSKGLWNQTSVPLANASRLPPYLRAAYGMALDGKISVDQLSTLLFLWEAVTDISYDLANSLRALEVVDANGQLTETALATFIEAPAAVARAYRPGKMDQPDPTPDAVIAQALQNAVRVLPRSEQFFWAFRYPKGLLARLDRFEGVALQYETPPFADLFTGLFFRTRVLSGWYQIDPGNTVKDRWATILVPSVGLMRVLQTLRFGQNALQPVPQLGVVGPEEAIDQILQNRRVLGFHFPGVRCLATADGFVTGKFGYTYHDLFHLVWGSHHRVGPRAALTQFYRRISPLSHQTFILEINGKQFIVDSNSASRDKLGELREKIIDVSYTNRGQDTAALLQSNFSYPIALPPAERGSQISQLYSMDGYLYLLIDMAQAPNQYEAWFGEPIEQLLARVDGERAERLEISSLSVYRAARRLFSQP